MSAQEQQAGMERIMGMLTPPTLIGLLFGLGTEFTLRHSEPLTGYLNSLPKPLKSAQNSLSDSLVN